MRSEAAPCYSGAAVPVELEPEPAEALPNGALMELLNLSLCSPI
jgi:hypothetical protein